jgi:carbon storage regulator
MLVITRRRGERVRIGQDIEVMVTRIVDGNVRLAIKAPPSVPIVRTELQPKEEGKCTTLSTPG